MKDAALEAIELLPRQAEQAWEETAKLAFSPSYKKVQSLIIAGMGGSAYSFYVIKNLFEAQLKIPLYLVNDYHLPAFVRENTLVIASSYSGGTEETLSAAGEAILRGAKISAVTSGGELGQLMRKHNFPYYHFNPKYNPSKQPRMGQGYMILGTMGILRQIGILKFPHLKFTNLLKQFELLKKKAQEMIGPLRDKILVFVAAQHLSGNAHILRNQTNETAKNFAAYSLLPELNHHLMEGLKNPKNKNLLFFFLNSSLYSLRIKKRMQLTKEVVRKNQIPVLEYKAKSKEPLSEVLEILVFGGYLTYYLAKAYRVDPNKIPWVDYFKAKLAS